MTNKADLPLGARSHLDELYRSGLLDTPAEEIFDRFTALASKILNAPVALISLVDENRQFFKSQVGLPEPWATERETPLTHSFCQHVVAGRAPLIINDASRDPMVAQNRAIHDLGVLAYAGIPLITPAGEAIGSFCAIDSQPRAWSEHEIEVLTGLAQAVMTEIALRFQARELEDARRQSEGILNSITDAFFQLDEQWRFSYINDQAVHLLRRPREQLLGRSIWDEYNTSALEPFAKWYRQAVQTRKPVTFEEYLGVSGVWLEVHAYPGEGGLSIYFHDITARKQDEQRLLLLESVVVHANDTVIITEALPLEEPGPRILYVNEAFSKMTGYQPEDVVGRSPRLLQGPETSRQTLKKMHDALFAQQSITVEVLNYRKDGSSFWSEMSLVPVADGTGACTHWISIQRDITERRRIQEVLQAAKSEAEFAREEAELARAEAERANLAKSEFLSRMSHELRTPLNAILGFGQLLQTSDLAPEDMESADHIVLAGRHLLGLINEVLDISRIESGKMPLNLEPVAISQLCQETVALMRGTITARGLTLDNRSSECLGYVQADRQRLKQILVNLLSNATKYNRDGGSIIVFCQTVNGKQLRVCVHDNGIGIAPEKLKLLFTPFERLGAESTSVEGLGIGLAISRRLAESMGGTLGVESELGAGSNFWIELPLSDTPEEQRDDEYDQTHLNEASERLALSLTKKGNCKILYIEDNLPNLRLVEHLLRRCSGVQLLAAEGGGEGLQLAREELPDLILLDLHLPGMSGEQVLHQLKESEATRDIPVVIISAEPPIGQVEHLLESGARAYLEKPLVLHEFLKVLDATLFLKNEPS